MGGNAISQIQPNLPDKLLQLGRTLIDHLLHHKAAEVDNAPDQGKC